MRAMGLGRVFNHHDAAPLCDREHRRHIRRLPRQMDGNDSPSPVADRRLDPRRVHFKGPGIAVHQHRPRPHIAHRQRGSNVGVGRQDDLIPSPNIQPSQGQTQGIESIADPHRMLNPNKARKGGFKRLHRPAQDEIAAAQHLVERGLDFRLQCLILSRQIHKRDDRRINPLRHRHTPLISLISNVPAAAHNPARQSIREPAVDSTSRFPSEPHLRSPPKWRRMT